MPDDLAAGIDQLRRDRDRAQRQLAIATAALLRVAESSEATARDARAAIEAMEKMK